MTSNNLRESRSGDNTHMKLAPNQVMKKCRSQKLSSRAGAVRCLENLRDRFEPLVSYSLLASVRHKVQKWLLLTCTHILSSQVLCGELSDWVGQDDTAAVWLLLTAEIPKRELTCSVQIKSSIT